MSSVFVSGGAPRDWRDAETEITARSENRGLDLHVVFGLSYGFLFLRTERTSHHHEQGDTAVDNEHLVLRLL